MVEGASALTVPVTGSSMSLSIFFSSFSGSEATCVASAEISLPKMAWKFASK